MKRVLIILLCLLFSILPCVAKSVEKTENSTSKVFIYHLPDDVDIEEPKNEIENIVVTDDITADTSETAQDNQLEPIENNDVVLDYIVIEDYEIGDMYSDVLKGYALYDENEIITLEDIETNLHKINLKKPARVKGGKYVAKTDYHNDYSKLSGNVVYSIAPISSTNYRTKGGFTFGTSYSQFIDTAELEQSTGVFSRYDTKHFALSTAYYKTINSTNNNYNDNFYFTPELKINQYFTLKGILSADVLNNKRKTELVISINPFGKKDIDRMRIDFGINATYNMTNEVLKNQLKFSTNFKL